MLPVFVVKIRSGPTKKTNQTAANCLNVFERGFIEMSDQVIKVLLIEVELGQVLFALNFCDGFFHLFLAENKVLEYQASMSVARKHR